MTVYRTGLTERITGPVSRHSRSSSGWNIKREYVVLSSMAVYQWYCSTVLTRCTRFDARSLPNTLRERRYFSLEQFKSFGWRSFKTDNQVHCLYFKSLFWKTSYYEPDCSAYMIVVVYLYEIMFHPICKHLYARTICKP